MRETNFKIRAVVNPADREMFLDVPGKVYENDPNWVPPIRSSIAKQLALSVSNPFLQYGKFQQFIALREGKPVGRIVAAINNRLIEKTGEAIGLFGYFECIEDFSVAQGLLDAASQWLGDRNITLMRGPIDLSTHNNCLCLIEGFDSPPLVMMPYNPVYYPHFFEQAGLHKAKDAYAYNMPLETFSPEKFVKAHGIACKAGVKFRPVHTKGEAFEKDCRSIYHLFTKTFADNWSSTPRSEEEFLEEAKELQPLIDPDIFPIGEYEGEMVGFLMAIPDYNIPLKQVNGKLNWLGILKFLWYRRQIDQARVIVICSLPEHRRKLIPLALMYLSLQGGIQKGKPYKRTESSWVWEDNFPSRKLIEASGSYLYKKYRMYEKELIIDN